MTAATVALACFIHEANMAFAFIVPELCCHMMKSIYKQDLVLTWTEFTWTEFFGCDAVSLCKIFPTFKRIFLPHLPLKSFTAAGSEAVEIHK
jgi:hypothetical protein